MGMMAGAFANAHVSLADLAVVLTHTDINLLVGVRILLFRGVRTHVPATHEIPHGSRPHEAAARATGKIFQLSERRAA